jgi:hypothetical protein
VVKSRTEVLSWFAAAKVGAEHVREVRRARPFVLQLADQWLDGVERGRTGRRRGRGKPYAETKILAMDRSLKYHLIPEFGPRYASEIRELDWQAWIDVLARRCLARPTIAKHISVASDIYAWASAPPAVWSRATFAPRRTAAERREASPTRRPGA